jgi:hypothetical protein
MGSPGRASQQPLGGRFFGLPAPGGRGAHHLGRRIRGRRYGQTASRSMPSPPRAAGTSAPGPGAGPGGSRSSSGRGRCPFRRRGSVAAPHCRTYRAGAGDCPLYQAIEQLGSDRLDVRIGGIYALERIAHDSPRDHLQCWKPWPHSSASNSHGQWPPKEPGAETPGRTTRPGVQAAVAVIGRRIRRHGGG